MSRKINVKMIVTDLDRTLLHKDKTISDYAAQVLNQCQKRGIKVIFATARPKRTVVPYIGAVPADALILHNGAVIYAENQVLKNYGIASEIKDNIMLSLSKDFPESTLSIEIEDALYANFDISALWPDTLSFLSDFTNLPDKPADKIIIGMSAAENIDSFAKYIPDDLYIEICDAKLGMIMHRDATKGEAVKMLAAYFDLPIEEVIAFGDDYNDISMLRECGIGVAVANALTEVKDVADYICDTNDNDGVAKWLEENVL